MALDFPVDKLGVINSSLAQTGDYQCAVLDDGSEEFTVASPAYDRALSVLLEDHSWNQATKVWTLTASPTAPGDPAWDTAFVLPPDLIHILSVRLSRNASDALGVSVPYDFLANQLVINAQGGPPPPSTPITPGIVRIKGISTDNSDSINGTPRFVAALQAFTMSGIYRALHGNTGEADRMFLEGERLAQKARTRHDQQKGKRRMFKSGITAARFTRLPSSPWGSDSNPWKW